MSSSMADYLSVVAPDSAGTLTVRPQRILVVTSEKHQKVHIADDTSEYRVSISDASIFTVQLAWTKLLRADADTIFDYFNSSTKGNGFQKSFKWDHPKEANVYVVRFASKLKHRTLPGITYSIPSISLKVLGKAA